MIPQVGEFVGAIIVSTGNRGEIAKVKEAFAASSEAGMQSFDSALLKLYKDGKIGMEEALANADSRANLEASIHFQ